MKTFTNCAEKKAKQILNLLQGYTESIRMTAILILLLMGVSNAWAGNNIAFQNGANFYFDPYYNATQTVNKGTIQLAVRKYQNTGGDDYGWYTGVTTLTNIENTRLYYASNFEGPSWNDQGLSFHGWAMISNSTAKNNATTEYWTGNNSAWYSEFKNYGLNKGSTYLFVATSASKGQSIEPSGAGYLSGGYSALNSQQTIKTVVDGTVANSKATISITSYKMTDNGTATEQTATLGTGAKDSYITAARTATTTLTVGDVAIGYQFDGWYTAATGGTQLLAEKTYTYYPTAATTVYARFSTKQHTVLFGKQGNGTITAKVGSNSITSGNKVNYGSEVVFTATPSTGYQIEGWYKNSDCTTSLGNGTNNTYTVTIIGGTNVYVKFEEIPANIHDINYTAQGTGWTYGNSNPTTAEEGATVTFVVNPTAGYRVSVSSDGPELTGPNANNQYTFTMPTKDVKITVDAKPEQYTVTLNKQSGTGGTSSVTATYLAAMPNITAPIRTGYTFNGYFDATSGGAKYYNADGSSAKNWDKTAATTLYAQWTANQYTITYKDQGNVAFSGTHASTPPTTHTYGVETTLKTASKTGYTFEGWHTDESCTNKVTSLGATAYTANITLYAKWTANQYTITYKDQGNVAFSGTHASTPPTTHTYGVETTLKTASKTGYTFEGWHTDESCTNKVTSLGATAYTANITLYAKWIPYGDCVFFKNNLNWDEVYVYFYSSDKYWTDDKGTGANMDSRFPMDSDHRPHYRKFRGKMTRIGLTDIWYFDYISAAKRIDPTNWEQIKDHTDNADNDINYSNIAFTAHEQYDHSFFDNTKVIRRGDFKPDMQLFIPQTDQTPTYLNKHDGVSAKYYNKGLWLKYNSTESGYNWSSNVGNWDNSKNYFTSEIAGGYSFTAEVELNAGSTYDFKIHNQNGTWFGKNGTMTQDNCTNWWFKEEVNDNAKIKPTVNGTYIFTAYLGDGKVIISLDYPLSTGDYRLAYLDKTANSFHPGHYIKKRNTSKNDTVSFFIHYDNEPQVIAQCCTAIDNNGNATWETITDLVNPAASITETGVYNFTLQQIEGQNDPQLLNQARPYTGNYYIRTDAAPGGWKSFRQEGNKMTYSSYAATHEDFDHYFCEWVSQEKGLKNVKYTVANDYSYCISDTLSEDIDSNHPTIVTDKNGDLPSQNGNLINANVRWGWDSKTNKLRRAYIAGSGHKKDRFLVLQGNEHLADINGNRYTGQTAEGQDRYNLTDNEVVLDDMGNWIYQIDVQANKDTEIKLTALYNDLVQYFKGTETKSVPLLASTATKDYKIRLIYDFKTNHLVVAWLAGGETIEGEDQELGADMMIIRHNQDPAEQLNFDPNTRQLSQVGTAYAVMTFDKYFLNNKNPNTGNALATADEKSSNERMFYWISFPFDVKISDVFGFGEYGDYWIMEYYDGEARAKEGYWAETETFWKYITNKNYVLKAGQGYVLCLNLNKMGFTSTVFANTAEVSLYFPSTGPLNTITGELPAAVDVPAHTCTIERDNRNIYDSHWNLIGVPGFANIEDVGIGEHLYKTNPLVQDSVSFYYEYIPATNKYHTQTQTETFQTMYSYMIQYTGTINWRTPAFSDPALMARRIGELPDQYTLRLVLHSGDKEEDQTFVQLQEERATSDFDMNLDLAKMMNSGANIYTLTANTAIMVAGNALPMEKATVPVGVRVDAAGEYTFRMPDGTDGIAVTLVDNATGTHTNMLMSEYTVTLNAGTIENRFYLVVDPDRTATSVENIGEEADKAKGVEKFLIDGKLFIRTADGIFDAKGQRL